ncbi:MAG: N-acetylmuramoyl-L-alanine amidase [Clostridiales bacterium]|jgi:N-acetylmuramoyl-L-alanine amidase|nr:N-acetylmuramoyl-L-alanine amidase [Clostridiales bacterium]
MFLFFKKKYIIASLLVILTFCAFLSFFYGVKAASIKLRGEIIVVDAGHGGRDGGVTGKETKVKESDLNLKYASLLKTSLEKQGYRVVMTRNTEDGLYDAAAEYGAYGEESRKSQDMKRRKEIIEEAKPACVVSIHMNFFGQSSARGAQVFYNAPDKESKKLSQNIQSKINVLNNKYADKNVSTLPGDYYIIKCTEYASCLIECGFLSNKEDEKLLINPSYQAELIYEITNGIIVYLNTRDL